MEPKVIDLTKEQVLFLLTYSQFSSFDRLSLSEENRNWVDSDLSYFIEKIGNNAWGNTFYKITNFSERNVLEALVVKLWDGEIAGK